MKLVLDANVALRWVLNEQHSDKAKALRDAVRKGVYELQAPDFFPVEVAHALTRAERRRAIPRRQASVLLADILLTAPVLHSTAPLLVRATDISSQTQASVYDLCYYLLAEETGCQFVTADRKLISAFPSSPTVIELSSL
jgi:predicted nucleic acid-binding protein